MIEASPWRNHLLASLSQADRELLVPHLETVDLDVGQTVETHGQRISHLLFVESGVLSIIGRTAGHCIEVGMIGREGMTGSAVLLHQEVAANQAFVLTGGQALRISVAALHEAARASHSLASTLLNYIYSVVVQANETALVNGRGRLDERLARWLLMWHDRAANRELTATHELLASLLGVRRQAVTKMLHELEGRHLIRSQRGRLGIMDRAGLLALAGGFYGTAERAYERAIGVSIGCLPRPLPAEPDADCGLSSETANSLIRLPSL